MNEGLTAQRRTIQFETMQDILDDVERLAEQGMHSSGNWSPGQILGHVADAIRQSIDGYEVIAPERSRRIAARGLETLLAEGFPTGIALEGEMARYIPAEGETLHDAMPNLRAVIGRLDTAQMEAVHPFLDKMDHGQWTRFHCRHAELHFSFLHPAD